MKKHLKRCPKLAIYIIVVVALLAIPIVLWGNSTIASIGVSLGEQIGSSAGKVMGSFEALTDYKMAYAEGKEEGLSAEDTTAEIANKIQELKKLEVFVASVKLEDTHSISDDDYEYASLYLLKGNAIFTVDFGEVDIFSDGDTLHILIPEPQSEFIIDQRQIEKVAEYQKHFWSGDAEAGFDAYLNSMAKIDEKIEKRLIDDQALMNAAKDAARSHVLQLVYSVSISKSKVEVDFKEVKEGEQTSEIRIEETKEENNESGIENE